MNTVIVWARSKAGDRAHAFDTDPNRSWTPTRAPRSMCGNARASAIDPERNQDLPRCQRCAPIAAHRVDRGLAKFEETPS